MCDKNCCPECNGSGVKTYPDSGTWKDFPGLTIMRAFTKDTCNRCWGTGDLENIGINLKEHFYFHLRLKKLFKAVRFDITNEKRLQIEIADQFDRHGIVYTKEYPLKKGIIDFYIPDIKVGIEIKIKGRALDIFHQLDNYAECNDIHSFVLITSKPLTMPEKLNKKTLSIINISTAWL